MGWDGMVVVGWDETVGWSIYLRYRWWDGMGWDGGVRIGQKKGGWWC